MKVHAPLHHLATPDQWERCFDGDCYTPDSLETEGYVHLSTADQLAGSRARHFPANTQLLAIDIAPECLTALLWEDLHGHGIFPHHYGPIPAKAIRAVREWSDYHVR
ncbi:MAG: DUF952 domain-containing protein [Armatimonadota bacterium]